MSIVTKESNPELYNTLFKEDILGAFLLVNDYRILTNEELEDVKNAIKLLQQENQQLKEIIEKAKKYVKKHIEVWETEELQQIDNFDDDYDPDILLDILNGDDK